MPDVNQMRQIMKQQEEARRQQRLAEIEAKREADILERDKPDEEKPEEQRAPE